MVNINWKRRCAQLAALKNDNILAGLSQSMCPPAGICVRGEISGTRRNHVSNHVDDPYFWCMAVKRAITNTEGIYFIITNYMALEDIDLTQ